jgi:cytochrome d ubiquinol oxidase subunit II
LLIGLTALAMFALHGLLFLAMKTEGVLEERVRSYVPRVLVLFFALNTASVIATAVAQKDVSERFTSDIWPVVFPALALVAFVVCWRAVQRKDDFLAFAASAAMIGLLLISGAVGMYPNLLISTQGSDLNLTVDNASSANNTLAIMLAFAAVGIPLVLLYTAGVYFFFRGKTSLGPDSY